MTLTLSITLPITLVGDGYSCGGVPHRRTTLKYTKKIKKHHYPNTLKNVKTLLNFIIFYTS
jgi:hypothetical protein